MSFDINLSNASEGWKIVPLHGADPIGQLVITLLRPSYLPPLPGSSELMCSYQEEPTQINLIVSTQFRLNSTPEKLKEWQDKMNNILKNIVINMTISEIGAIVITARYFAVLHHDTNNHAIEKISFNGSIEYYFKTILDLFFTNFFVGYLSVRHKEKISEYSETIKKYASQFPIYRSSWPALSLATNSVPLPRLPFSLHDVPLRNSADRIVDDFQMINLSPQLPRHPLTEGDFQKL